MIIKEIKLKNFRAHKYLEFKPAETGITSIYGKNGAGKSTIVDAFSWALFGTRLHGLKNKNYIKEGIDAKEDEVSVEATIQVEGKEYIIKRQIVNNDGSSQCWIYNEGKELSGPGVSHSELLIRRILGINESGFLTSVFIQQKEVDQILDNTPKERAKVIEKMIGIDAISDGIQNAKADSKDFKKSADLIRFSDIEEIEKELNNHKKEMIKTKEDFKSSKKEIENVKRKKDELDKKVDYIEKIKEKKYQVKSNYDNIKTNLKNLKSSLKNNLELFQSIKVEFILNDNFSEMEKELQKQENKLNKINTNLAKAHFKEEELTNLAKAKIQISLIDEEIEVLENIKVTKGKIEKTKIEYDTFNSDFIQTKKHIKMLKDGISICPTCGSEIDNSPEHIKKYKEKFSKEKEKIESIQTELKDLENRLKYEEDKIQLINTEKEKRAEKEKADKNLKILQDKIIKANQEQVSLESQVNILRNKISSYRENIKQQELRQSLKTKIKEDEKELESLEREEKKVKTLLEKIKEKEFSNVTEIKESQKKETKKYQELYAKLEMLKERAKQQKVTYDLLDKQLKDNIEAKEKYNQIVYQLRVSNQSVDTLSKFKEDRLKKAIPSLTKTASDILNKLTDGEFIELILDDKFNCSTRTKEGTIRSDKQLSGGEKSSAAISLRLAISFFLSSSSENLLIIDEALVSMSSERVQIALEMLSSLQNTQVILIAHNDSANDMADKIINL